MSQTRDQQSFTISEVAADRHEPVRSIHLGQARTLLESELTTITIIIGDPRSMWPADP